MSNRQLRVVLRWIHIVGGSLIATFVYSSWGANPLFLDLMRWAVIPTLIVTGLVLWQQARLNKFRQGMGKRIPGTRTGA
jgi:thiosulfate reductase cytochrome b subunit